MPAYHSLDFVRFRKQDFDLGAVAQPDCVHDVVSFLREPAGIDRDDASLRSLPERHVHQHHAFRLKSGHHGKPRSMRGDCPGEKFLGV